MQSVAVSILVYGKTCTSDIFSGCDISLDDSNRCRIRNLLYSYIQILGFRYGECIRLAINVISIRSLGFCQQICPREQAFYLKSSVVIVIFYS